MVYSKCVNRGKVSRHNGMKELLRSIWVKRSATSYQVDKLDTTLAYTEPLLIIIIIILIYDLGIL